MLDPVNNLPSRLFLLIIEHLNSFIVDNFFNQMGFVIFKTKIGWICLEVGASCFVLELGGRRALFF